MNESVSPWVCGCGRKPKSMADEAEGIHVSRGVSAPAIMARPRGKPHRSFILGAPGPASEREEVGGRSPEAEAPVRECGGKDQVSQGGADVS